MPHGRFNYRLYHDWLMKPLGFVVVVVVVVVVAVDMSHMTRK